MQELEDAMKDYPELEEKAIAAFRKANPHGLWNTLSTFQKFTWYSHVNKERLSEDRVKSGR